MAIKRSLLLPIILLIFWSTTVGLTLAQGSQNTNQETAQALYIEHCGTCHLPIPPEVLPTETWKEILEKPQKHYGTQVTTLVRITQVVLWQYLSTYARSLNPQEPQPYFISQSRYFRALHPQVDLPDPLTHRSCAVCHPGAAQLDYQTLAPQWQD